jgi:hypothetical protein
VRTRLCALQRDLPYQLSTPELRTLGQTVSVPSDAPFFGAHYRIEQVGPAAPPRPAALPAGPCMPTAWQDGAARCWKLE